MYSKFFILFLFFPFFVFSQKTDSLVFPKKTPYLLGAGLIYGGTLIGLNELWYKNAPRSSFHFFDDGKQWEQMDKVGHGFTAFYLSQISVKGFEKLGFKKRKSLILGSITGFGLISTIEVFDGFAANYGASSSDLLANFSGVLLFSSQYAFWREIRLKPKFSFQKSPFPVLRPNTFGKTLLEQILKDYNGQTYWLSVDWAKFLGKNTKTFFPKFLTLAVGYGAGEMLYGNPTENEAAGYKGLRRYFLGIDIELSQIRTRHIWLKKTFQYLSVWRIPAPALEYNRQDGLKWHWLK